MRTENVEITWVELQPPAGHEKRTRHPTRGQSHHTFASLQGLANQIGRRHLVCSIDDYNMGMRTSRFVAAVLAASATACAADWLTDGYDSKRTAWQRDEKTLSTATAKNIKLLWKLKFDNEPRQMHSLFPPLIIGKLNTKDGPREVVIETGVSDNLYAIDVEKGEILWKKHFDSSYTPPRNPRGDILCPGGITATPVIAPSATPGKYVIYAASWDGKLHQLNAADGEDVAPPTNWMPPNGKPYA